MPGLKQSHWNHKAIKVIARSLARDRLWQSLCAAILLLTSTWMMVQLLPHWIAAVLVLPIFGATYWIIVLGPWRPIRQHRLFLMLEKQPDHFVWVYGLINQMSPYGFLFMRQGILYFKLADGQEISVSIPDDRLKMVSRFFNRVLPHATFGYSAERERMYKTNPEGLRKEV
ncbi:MAG: hypothetical protein KDC34_10820 [Saprospiraceae bacterium]|nr:hypothetical protein [Saprospiraceae bacterium]